MEDLPALFPVMAAEPAVAAGATRSTEGDPRGGEGIAAGFAPLLDARLEGLEEKEKPPTASGIPTPEAAEAPGTSGNPVLAVMVAEAVRAEPRVTAASRGPSADPASVPGGAFVSGRYAASPGAPSAAGGSLAAAAGGPDRRAPSNAGHVATDGKVLPPLPPEGRDPAAARPRRAQIPADFPVPRAAGTSPSLVMHADERPSAPRRAGTPVLQPTAGFRQMPEPGAVGRTENAAGATRPESVGQTRSPATRPAPSLPGSAEHVSAHAAQHIPTGGARTGVVVQGEPGARALPARDIPPPPEAANSGAAATAPSTAGRSGPSPAGPTQRVPRGAAALRAGTQAESGTQPFPARDIPPPPEAANSGAAAAAPSAAGRSGPPPADAAVRASGGMPASRSVATEAGRAERSGAPQGAAAAVGDPAADTTSEAATGQDDGVLPPVQGASPLPRATAGPGAPVAGQDGGGRVVDTLPVPFGTRGWGERLGERVLWHLKEGRTQAELRLNPPELGPLEVRITVLRDEASVHFAASSAPVREALEQALPRLREMFAEAGIRLADAGVSARDPGGRGAGGREPATAGPWGPDAGEVEDSPVKTGTRTIAGRGLLDLYA